MKTRRPRGATLGLAAACVFLVIIIGVALFFISKIIGGGREVASATDAGALNVAREALKRGIVDLRTVSVPDGYGHNVYADTEFGGLTDPPNTHIINLITYNRVVAQAMMVAKSADLWNTPVGNDTMAAGHAQIVAALADAVGKQLQQSISTATTATLPGDFNALSSQSNTKMWNGNKVTCTAITQGYLKAKGSTNIIFDDAIASNFNNWKPMDFGTGPNAANLPGSKDSLGIVVQSNGHYMPGYDTNIFPNAAVQLTGVPVFPNTKPHLVDIGTFNSDLAANAIFAATPLNAPANCFRANSKAAEAKSNTVGGALACAVVGVLNKDYVASIPHGFIRISNGPDALVANGSFGTPISNGDNDIFNNQLFTGPGAPQGANGITQDSAQGVFTTTPAYLTAWTNFNQRAGVYNNSLTYPAVVAAAGISGPAYVAFQINPAGTAYGVGTFVPQADLPGSPDPLLDMATNPANYDNNEGGLRWGSDCQAPYANVAQLETIGTQGNFNCSYIMYDDNLTGPCALVSNVDTWQANYACGTPLMSSGIGIASSGSHQGMDNVEYLKAELLAKIAGRLGGHYCADVSIPNGKPSGVKYFSRGVPGSGGSAVAYDPMAGGASNVINFETVATPLDYLTQISHGAGSTPGPCGMGPGLAIINQIVGRLQEISPEISTSQVLSALQSRNLHLKNSGTDDNGTLYLYVDTDHHTVKMCTQAQLPEGWSDPTYGSTSYPDGLQPQNLGQGYCVETYPVNGWVVDTQFTLSGTGKGDAHYHDQPFTQPATNRDDVSYSTDWWWGALSSDVGGTQPINGQDMAMFTASSGAQNILGELVFLENVQGTTFCKPN